MRRTLSFALLAVVVATSCSVVMLYSALPAVVRAQEAPVSRLTPEEQRHLKNVRQLTFGGQNAEAYFSADDKQLIFQHQGAGVPCDQIYSIVVETPDGKTATPR